MQLERPELGAVLVAVQPREREQLVLELEPERVLVQLVPEQPEPVSELE
jgi:hypothetical protein